MIRIGFGFSSIFALPVAIIFDIEDGITSIDLCIGPFFFELSWGGQ